MAQGKALNHNAFGFPRAYFDRRLSENRVVTMSQAAHQRKKTPVASYFKGSVSEQMPINLKGPDRTCQYIWFWACQRTQSPGKN